MPSRAALLLSALSFLAAAAEPQPHATAPETPAGEAPLAIVPRKVWDPDGTPRGLRYSAPPARTYTRIVVHHSDFTDAPGPAGIKRYHLEVSGFSDIGYHFVIGADGVVYEARPLAFMGAHAGVTREGSRKNPSADPDWGSVGIVLDGYFGDTLPTEAQRAALLALIAHLRATLPRVDDVIGHREVRDSVLAAGRHPLGDVTVCPGDALFAWLAIAVPPKENRVDERARAR